MSFLSHPWNNAVILLHMCFADQPLSTGSGFFWKHDSRTFLVTNWHNLTGRNPRSGATLSPNGGRPDNLRSMCFRKISEPDAQGNFEIRYEAVRLRICDPDLTNHQWFEHPVHGMKVDIGALDVTDQVAGYLVAHVNELEADAIHDPRLAQDVFVVGYPFGAIAGAPAPIWKRGTIAIDPTFDVEGLPKMLIDTATREGMSGSVVLARHLIWGKAYTKKDGTQSDPVLIGQHDTVLGIYSGRHYPDLDRAQIGIVWRRLCIEETVLAKKPADLPPG